MAVSSKKLKGTKDGERKQAKKIEEEVVRTEERKEELVIEVDVAAPSAEEQMIASSASPPSAPEHVYEEPVLTQLIVSRFDSNDKFVRTILPCCFMPVNMLRVVCGSAQFAKCAAGFG